MAEKETHTGGENALIQGIYCWGLSCLMSNSRMHVVLFKLCIFNWINVRNGCYQLVDINVSLRIDGCLVAEPNHVQSYSKSIFKSLKTLKLISMSWGCLQGQYRLWSQQHHTVGLQLGEKWTWILSSFQSDWVTFGFSKAAPASKNLTACVVVTVIVVVWGRRADTSPGAKGR